MAQIDTRHDERELLFKLFVAKHNNDIDTLISTILAKMEDEDVKAVERRFIEWKENRK